MFRLVRRVVRQIIEKIRKVEVFLFNVVAVQRRGTMHSISYKPGKDTLRDLRRRATIQSLCEVRKYPLHTYFEKAIVKHIQRVLKNEK